MNPIQLMELHKEQFTQNDLRIYQSIIANPEQVVSMTTSVFAAQCGVSQPALSRFVKGLGYERYRDFRSDLVAWLTERSSNAMRDSDRLPYFDTLSKTIEAAEQLLTEDYLRELAAFVTSHRRVYASGTGKSLQPAKLFEIIMRRNMRGVHAVTSDEINELGDYMDEEDLLVLFSVSGRKKTVGDAAHINGDLLLVTANPGYERSIDPARVVVLPFAGADAETASVSPVLFDIFVEILTGYIAML